MSSKAASSSRIPPSSPKAPKATKTADEVAQKEDSGNVLKIGLACFSLHLNLKAEITPSDFELLDSLYTKACREEGTKGCAAYNEIIPFLCEIQEKYIDNIIVQSLFECDGDFFQIYSARSLFEVFLVA